jgi:hypothetical protein
LERVSHDTDCLSHATNLCWANLFPSPFTDDHLPNVMSAFGYINIHTEDHLTHTEQSSFLFSMYHTFCLHVVNWFKSGLLLLRQRAVGVFVKIMWLWQEFMLWHISGELPYIIQCWAISGRWQPSSLGSSDFKRILPNQCFLTNLNDTRAMIPRRANCRHPCTSFHWQVQSEIYCINGMPADSIPSLECWSSW